MNKEACFKCVPELGWLHASWFVYLVWNNLTSKFSLKSDLLSVKYNSQTNNQETKHPTSARLTHKLACSTNVINMPILRAKTKHRTSLYCLVLCWKSQRRKQGNDAFIRMHFLHFYHAALNWDSQMRWHYNHKCLRILAFTSTSHFRRTFSHPRSAYKYAYSLFLIHALTYCNIHTHRVIIAHVYTSYIQGHSYILKDRTSNGILTLTISYDILTQEEEEGAITPIG